MTNRVKITITDKNSLILKRIEKAVNEKNMIKEHIRNGKDLSELKEYGIEFAMPLQDIRTK